MIHAMANLTELSTRARADFVVALEGIFEHSPWVAERAWEKRPFATREALWRALVEAMTTAPPDLQLGLVRAHPELAARRGALTLASTGEQAGSGLLTESEETRRIAALNALYGARFGHPFILAVRGFTPEGILANFESRLESTPEAELAECLTQIGRIARFRLEDRFPGTAPAGQLGDVPAE